MRRVVVFGLVVAMLAVAAASFQLGRHSPVSARPAASSAITERKVLYWHDPMVPGPRFDQPGKSPFMDMQLVPVYADEQAGTGVHVSPQVQQNLGIRTVAVTRDLVASGFDAVGAVQFDDREIVAVQTRVGGYVERLLVRAPMEMVRRGQPLAMLYAPDWLAPQNEYLALRRAGASADLLAAARDRLRALSIPDALVHQSEQAGAAQARFTVSAPRGGVVAELGVREGVAVTPGMTLFRIAGLDRLWAVADLPEAQAVRVARGTKVEAALQADPSFTFGGELKELLPRVDANTRTLQARVEVANPKGRLAPGMLLRLRLAGAAERRLVVPAEAVIRTGTRAVAIVRRAAGTFEPREVQLGLDLGERLEVLRGLDEGDEVVASGQFLIDSEARLKSALAAMTAGVPPAPATPAPAAPAASAAVHEAEGKVESVEPDGVTITHGPVPSLRWPGMTMGFGKPDPKGFADLRPGDTIRFTFRQGGARGYELVTVQRAGAAR